MGKESLIYDNAQYMYQMFMQRKHIVICVWLIILGLFSQHVAAEELIVSAAASLTNAMTAVGEAFEQAHPGITVVFNFASSGSLVQQMLHGAPVDVFASANQQFMNNAGEHRLILLDTRRDFVRNSLVLSLPANSALAITTITDLAKPEIQRIALGNPDTVPAGRYAREALQTWELWEILQDKFVFGNSVRQVLDYLRRGEVDAGLIYATDAVIGGDAVDVALEIDTQTPIVYPIAVNALSEQTALATQFVEFMFEDETQLILADFGFQRVE